MRAGKTSGNTATAARKAPTPAVQPQKDCMHSRLFCAGLNMCHSEAIASLGIVPVSHRAYEFAKIL